MEVAHLLRHPDVHHFADSSRREDFFDFPIKRGVAQHMADHDMPVRHMLAGQ